MSASSPALDRAIRVAAGPAYGWYLRRAWGRFERAANDPRAAQLGRLQALVRDNADTAFGRDHGFASIADLEGFRRRVPVRDYRELAPWIDRVAAGESRVLTREPVRMMELTGGSSSSAKWIPYTNGLLAEIAAGTEPWLFDVHRAWPALAGTRSYWSISPAARGPRTTPGGLPIGFDDDADYFGPLQRRVIASTMAVPRSVARAASVEQWRELTCQHLLAAEDLGLLSVWSPTFLTLLMEHLAAALPRLLRGLDAARAARIERALDRAGRVVGEALWPRLALVSCWADGPSASYLPALRRWFTSTPFQPKGLLATEGLISFPLVGQRGAVIAPAGHFLELVDLAHPGAPPVLVDEMQVGGEYSPVLSTAGGLYRYQLKDVVRCVGKVAGGLPLLRFERKLDCVSDLAGEKVDAGEAAAAIEGAARAEGLHFRFALLAPERGPPARYRLFVETEASDEVLERAARAVEAHLATGHHYRWCRDLGQLLAIAPVRVHDGWAAYQAALVERGQRAGDIKPTFLDVHGVASQVFAKQGSAP